MSNKTQWVLVRGSGRQKVVIELGLFDSILTIPTLWECSKVKRHMVPHAFFFTMAPTLVGPWSCGHPVGPSLTDISLNRREQTCPSPAEGRAPP